MLPSELTVNPGEASAMWKALLSNSPMKKQTALVNNSANIGSEWPGLGPKQFNIIV